MEKLLRNTYRNKEKQKLSEQPELRALVAQKCCIWETILAGFFFFFWFTVVVFFKRQGEQRNTPKFQSSTFLPKPCLEALKESQRTTVGNFICSI